MSSPSIISGLPEGQKTALDQLIRSNDYSGVDKLLKIATVMGVEVSRSAFARYVKQLREQDLHRAGPTLVFILDARAGAFTLLPTRLSGAEIIDAIPGARAAAVQVPGLRVRPPTTAAEASGGESAGGSPPGEPA